MCRRMQKARTMRYSMEWKTGVGKKKGLQEKLDEVVYYYYYYYYYEEVYGRGITDLHLA